MTICAVCGEEFWFKRRPKQKLCSRACRSQNNVRKDRSLADFDLTTGSGRAYARKMGFSVPKGKAGGKPVNLWARIDKSGECWVYVGPLNRDGYGAITRDYKTRMVHREIWEQERGPIPAGMHLCHKCDNPACVRPEHLFIGTPAENIADKVRKGRQAKGESNAHAKLTLDQVKAIKMSRESHTELARKYGVTDGAIWRIRRGLNWRHA